MSLDLLKNLLKELGHVIQLPGLTPDEDGYCCLSFDDKITVHIQLDKDTQNLTFFCEVGKVEDNYKRQVYEKMLEANVFWLGTGGATLGVNSETLTATLGYQEPLQGIDFQRFQQLLEGFVNTSEKWIDLIAELQRKNAPDSSTEKTDTDTSGSTDFQSIPV